MPSQSEPRRRPGLLGQILRYGGMTALSSAITIGLPVALHEGLGVSEEAAVALAYVLSVAVNFLVIRGAIFEGSESAARDAVKYVAMTLIYRAMEYGFFILFHTIAGFHYVATILVVQGVFTVIKFLTLRYVLFPQRDRHGSA